MRAVTPLPIRPDEIQVIEPGDFTADDINRIMRDVPGWVDPRLQQAREDWEAAREDATFGWDWREQGAPPHSIQEWSRFERDEQWPGMSEAADLARRYIIARDFNEFDPKRADMLWKLQKQ